MESLKIDLDRLVRQNLEKIRPYLQQNNISAYRLIGNLPDLPLAVDIYQDHAVVHLFASDGLELLTQLQSTLQNQLQIRDFFYKDRTKDDLNLPPGPPA